MVFEHHDECPSQWKAIESISAKLSINHETLRQWVRRAETDAGERPGPTTDERAKMRALERENKELRRANEMADSTGQRNRTCEMSGSRSREGADAGATRALERGAKGAGLPAARTRRAAHRDADLKVAITRVHAENLSVYGADKVWAQLNREGIRVARCTVERLMRELGLCGVRRGRAFRVTTHADDRQHRPLDLVERRQNPAPLINGGGASTGGHDQMDTYWGERAGVSTPVPAHRRAAKASRH